MNFFWGGGGWGEGTKIVYWDRPGQALGLIFHYFFLFVCLKPCLSPSCYNSKYIGFCVLTNSQAVDLYIINCQRFVDHDFENDKKL